MTFKLLTPFVLLFGLSACMSSGPTHWQHKTIPSDQWRGDVRSCQRGADKELSLDTSLHTDAVGQTSYENSMRSFQAGKKAKQLVYSCMRKKGYIPVN